MGIAVGIDLGTTNTVVAAVKNGVAMTLADSQGNKLIPSVVAFHPNGTVQVGWPALERRIIDPENTVYSVKRLIGRSFQSPEVAHQRGRFPFVLVEGPKHATLVETRAETYALPEVSAFVLRRAKAIAEAALGETVDAAVITVPANFDDPQRASTKMAGKLAGLEVLRILNEPTAAALAYGRSPDTSERLCVYDLGGGTFDVTLLDVSKGVFEVLATAGDTALGGDDIDGLIVDRMAEMAMRTLNVDPRSNPVAVARMRIAAEALKKELTFRAEASTEVHEIGRAEGGVPLTLKCRLSREDLERISQPIIDRTMAVTRAAMSAAGVEPDAFERIILVGGATRMPIVVRHVQDFFKKKVDQRINPDEVVALGAAIQAYTLGSRKGRGRKPQRPATEAPPTPRVEVPDALAASIPPEMRGAITATTTTKSSKEKTRHGLGPDPLAPPSLELELEPGAPSEQQKADAQAGLKDEKRKGDVPPAQTHPTRPGMRKVGDVREVRSQRFDPRAEPDEDEVITSEFQQAPPVPSTPSPRAGAKPAMDLPPTRPAMPAIRDEGASKTRKNEEMTFSRGTPTVQWSSEQDEQNEQNELNEEEELDLPKPPALMTPMPPPNQGPRPARHPPSAAPAARPPISPAPALPGERSSVLPRPPPLPAAAQSRPRQGEILLSPDDLKVEHGESLLLIDVTPLSLRVETVGGYSDTLITANSAVPCDRTRIFSTASDGQSVVFIRVAQGESLKFAENTFLGELELSGLVPLPRGEAQIAVTFEIDADGILAVKAKDGRTGKETHTRMHVFGAQTDEADLQQMRERQLRRAVV